MFVGCHFVKECAYMLGSEIFKLIFISVLITTMYDLHDLWYFLLFTHVQS